MKGQGVVEVFLLIVRGGKLTDSATSSEITYSSKSGYLKESTGSCMNVHIRFVHILNITLCHRPIARDWLA